jgi:hypothetical protein
MKKNATGKRPMTNKPHGPTDPRPKPEKPPQPPPSTWRVTLVGDAQPLEVAATSAAISTHGVLAFKGGPDGQKLLRALAGGEWRDVRLVGDA